MPRRRPLLEVEDLAVEFRTRDGVVDAVDGLSYTVTAGRTLAIVGESGCGKTVSSLAVMGLLGPTARVTRGAIRFRGTDLLALPPKERRAYAGEHVAMVFQDALAALNPVHSVGYQLTEVLRVRRGIGRGEARRRAIELLDLVKVPRAADRIRDYPHQFSGGMRQRVMIAAALALDPEVLIADEPTTALDVTVQAQVLRLLAEIQAGAADGSRADHPRPRRRGVGRRRRDRDVRRARRGAGHRGARSSPLRRTRTRGRCCGRCRAWRPTTRRRTRRRAVDSTSSPGARPGPARFPSAARSTRAVTPRSTCAARRRRRWWSCRADGPACATWRPRSSRLPVAESRATSGCVAGERNERRAILEVRDLAKVFPVRRGVVLRRTVGAGAGRRRRVVHACGAAARSAWSASRGPASRRWRRMLVGVERPTRGQVLVDGVDVTTMSRAARRELRRRVQIVFQDPYTSLNPRMSVGEIVGEPFRIHPDAVPKGGRDRAVKELLELVGLDPGHVHRYPHQFSGGQRQRIGIARALAVKPQVLVCDEPVSALDVSVQGQVINLLEDLQDELGLSYLFIAHDLAVVRHIADEVAVMYLGRIVEHGTAADVYDRAAHPVHASADVGGAGARPGRPPGQRRDRARGRHPVAGRPAVGLPLPHPLLARRHGWRRAGEPTADGVPLRCATESPALTDTPPSGTSPPATTPSAPPSPPHGSRARMTDPTAGRRRAELADAAAPAACSTGSPRSGIDAQSWSAGPDLPEQLAGEPTGGRWVGAARRPACCPTTTSAPRSCRVNAPSSARRWRPGVPVLGICLGAQLLAHRRRRRGDGQVRRDRAWIVRRRTARQPPATTRCSPA